jgi:hypothetical protein
MSLIPEPSHHVGHCPDVCALEGSDCRIVVKAPESEDAGLDGCAGEHDRRFAVVAPDSAPGLPLEP